MSSLPGYIGFDDLYQLVCDKLRDTKMTTIILEKISLSCSDYDRVQLILKEDPDIVTLFNQHVTNCFETKDELKAQELLTSACRQNSVELINHALRLCYCESPIVPQGLQLEFLQDIREPSNLQRFVETPHATLNPAGHTQNLIAEILARRSTILFQNGKFESCIRDTFRSVTFGLNKTFDIVLRLGLSYKQLGHFNEAKLTTQHALELLRLSSLDNETKCKETIRLVAIIKEIQQLSGMKDTGKEKGGRSSAKSLGVKSFELFDGRHESLLGTSNAVELKYNPQRGRHIVAKKTIAPGSTLVVERPYAWSLDTKYYPTICQYCLEPEPASSDGIPCPDCSSVMFCNENCLQKSIKLFHAYECKILRLLDSSQKLGKMALLCFRTIVQTPLDDIIQSFKKLGSLQTPWSGSEVPSVVLGLNGEKKLDSSNYAAVFAQTTNSESRTSADLLRRTYAAIYLTICLRHVGYFKCQEKANEKMLSEKEKIVASVLLRHLQSTSCNAYGVNQISKSESSASLEIEEIGGGTYPIISTTNHNCNPNVYRFNIGKVCVVNTLHEIRESEEVFDSYGPVFSITPSKQRIQELDTQYLFKCECEACKENWPSFDQLRSQERLKEYKCPNCGDGKLDAASGKEKRKCSSCGKVIDFKKIQKLLKTAEEKYLRTKEIVLKQRFGSSDAEAVQKSICNYILTVQKVLVLPCKEIVEAQEVLKVYWSLCVRNGLFEC